MKLMVKRSSLIFGILAVLGAVLVVVAYLFVSGTIAAWSKYDSTIWGYHVSIKQVAADNANPKTLWVDAYFFSNPGRTAVFINVLVKNCTGDVVAEGVVPNELHVNKLSRIAIYLNDTLPSGTYSAVLQSKEGGSWVSPLFTVP